MTDLLDFLATRRSVKPSKLAEPGPTPSQLEEILKLGTRVPDHGKYVPWYILTFQGAARLDAGKKLRDVYARDFSDATPDQLAAEEQRLARAPLVAMVVSTIREGKNSQWEQILSAGALCYNLCLAANAHGFASNWLTEWITYSAGAKAALGIPAQDHIAGIIYIGTATEKPEDRDRPDLSRIVTAWNPDCTLNTGAGYGQPGAGLPEAGFKLRHA